MKFNLEITHEYAEKTTIQQKTKNESKSCTKKIAEKTIILLRKEIKITF